MGKENTSDKKVGGGITQIFTRVSESEAEQWEIIKTKLSTIETPSDKLAFLRSAMRDYIQNLPTEIKVASGMVLNEYSHLGKIFLDSKIQAEIDFIRDSINDNDILKDYVYEVEEIPKEQQQRVVWLYAIGLIDYLKDKNGHNIQSNSTLGKILAKGLGQQSDTIKKTLDRIEGLDTNYNGNIMEKFSSWINEECRRLNIERKK